jgi:hypothetical protein
MSTPKRHTNQNTKAHPYLAPNAQQWEGKKGKEIPVQMKNNKKYTQKTMGIRTIENARAINQTQQPVENPSLWFA